MALLPPKILAQEQQAIQTQRPPKYANGLQSPSDTAALCLSGGGIRSATFNLGVLQGLSKYRLLSQFDYLSTVSGGGFIGGWLSAWIKRDPAATSSARLSNVEAGLASNVAPRELQWLRDNSNYLSPRFSSLSLDTWTLAAVYMRNLLLNLSVFLPALMLMMLVPDLLSCAHANATGNVGLPIVLLAIVYGASSVAYIGLSLPAIRRQIMALPEELGILWLVLLAGITIAFASRLPAPDPSALQAALILCALLPTVWFAPPVSRGLDFSLRCGLPILISTFLFSMMPSGMGLYDAESLGGHLNSRNSALAGMAITGLGALAALLGFLMVAKKGRTLSYVLWGIGAVLVSLAPGAVGGAVWAALEQRLPLQAPFDLSVITIGIFLLGGTLLAGFVSRLTTEFDEEWWARSGAWLMIAVSSWIVISFCSLVFPHWLQAWAASPVPTTWLSIEGIKQIGKILSVIGGAIATAASIFGSSSSKSSGSSESANPVGLNFDTVLSAVGAVALLYILGYIGLLDLWLKGLWGWKIMALALFAIVLTLGWVIDLKKFSLHYFWKNRIVSAYLGASASTDEQNAALRRFERYSDDFNLSMSSLQNQRPLHVLNLALNQVASKRLSWQERKASSFTVSPYKCGNENPGYDDSENYTGTKGNRTGISLGTAVAISGAAVSPDMGYMMSSGVLRFLMTLFNVRLGVWLPNPGGRYCTEKTFSGLRALQGALNEALGRTDSTHDFVYLSDGGHFENLGLYEMVKRECRVIVVSDASTDPDYDFESLGQSVRKIRIDLSADITFQRIAIQQRGSSGVIAYAALGEIHYASGNVGQLIYIKPTLTGTGEPIDVRNYATMETDFPQQTIADQFFSESQFESYRRLGLHIVETLCGAQAPLTLGQLLVRAKTNPFLPGW
jgi:hypothetical protein